MVDDDGVPGIVALLGDGDDAVVDRADRRPRRGPEVRAGVEAFELTVVGARRAEGAGDRALHRHREGGVPVAFGGEASVDRHRFSVLFRDALLRLLVRRHLGGLDGEFLGGVVALHDIEGDLLAGTALKQQGFIAGRSTVADGDQGDLPVRGAGTGEDGDLLPFEGELQGRFGGGQLDQGRLPVGDGDGMGR